MPEFPSLTDANVRSSTYYVARTRVRCWHCSASTQVLALAMPRGHETLDEDAQDDSGGGNPTPDAWQRAAVNAILFYVEDLPDDVQGRLNRLSPCFRPAPSAAMLNSYWANHCEQCGGLLGDHELHCEPEGAFMPSDEATAANIELLHVGEPFEAAAAGYAFEPAFFGCMRKS